MSIEIERELTEIFAGLLDLEIDLNIFRGSVPDAKVNALGVILNGAASGNYPGAESVISVQLLGRWTDRADALEMCGKLDRLLPKYDPTYWLVKESSCAVYESAANGKKVWAVSLNLKVIRLGADEQNAES